MKLHSIGVIKLNELNLLIRTGHNIFLHSIPCDDYYVILLFLFLVTQGDHTYSAWAGGAARAMNLMSQYVKSISHIYATTAFAGSSPEGLFVIFYLYIWRLDG